MTNPRKRNRRNQRKKRVTNIEEMGLEQGKLYSFQGRFRYLYKDKKPEYTRTPIKIRKDDYIIFLEADLWKSSATKRKLVSHQSVNATTTRLKADGYDIISVDKHAWRNNKRQINYKPKEPIYSGMMYIAYDDKFGWINIVQMTKKTIEKQFKKVDLKNA